MKRRQNFGMRRINLTIVFIQQENLVPCLEASLSIRNVNTATGPRDSNIIWREKKACIHLIWNPMFVLRNP